MSHDKANVDIDLPLGDDLEALLAPEKTRGPESDELRERVYRRVVLGTAAGGGGSDPPKDGAPKKRFPARAAAVIGAVLGGIVVFGWPTSQRTPVPSAITKVDDHAPSAAVTVASESDDSNAIPSIAVEALPSVHAPPSRPAASSKPTCAICEEQLLLVEARTALGHGDFERALGRLRSHQTTYPNGELAQEREALRVRTLSAAGRMDEARAAFVAFEITFPSSAFLPSLRGVASQ